MWTGNGAYARGDIQRVFSPDIQTPARAHASKFSRGGVEGSGSPKRQVFRGL